MHAFFRHSAAIAGRLAILGIAAALLASCSSESGPTEAEAANRSLPEGAPSPAGIVTAPDPGSLAGTGSGQGPPGFPHLGNVRRAPNPFEGWTEPTGPLLSDAQVKAIATKAAADAGDEAAASTSQSVETTREAAMKATGQRIRLPTELPQPYLSTEQRRSIVAGEKAMLDSRTILVVMHGQFKLHAPAPSGPPTTGHCGRVLTGHVLEVTIDAHTGQYGIVVTDRPAPDLSELPTPTSIPPHK